MTNIPELADLDAIQQADLVKKKELSPTELVESAIARIEAHNGALNAVILPMFEQALRIAADSVLDGPFSGVPFLLKDLLAAYGGVPMQGGSQSLAGYVPKHDSYLTSRFKKAGLIVVGKTNTPEFGLVPTTEPKLFGATHNPWKLGFTTGGSSGGSAAAVAARFVPMAHANDGGGSIRIPASCCGVFGLKPTRARVTLGPDIGDIMSGLVIEHAVTRSVRDSAVLLDAIEGSGLGDPYVAPHKVRPYAEEVKREPGRLNIAFAVTAPTGVNIHPECVQAVEETARLLADLGHEVVEASPQIDGAELARAFTTVYSAGLATDMARVEQVTGREIKAEDVEPLTWSFGEIGKAVTATQYGMAIAYFQAVGREMARFLVKHDMWLTPTLAEPPLPHGAFDSPADNPLAPLQKATEFVPFTPIANLTGQPAMSVPLSMSSAGLPIGSHFFGRFGEEGRLFSLAAQLERARPWAGLKPPITS